LLFKQSFYNDEAHLSNLPVVEASVGYLEIEARFALHAFFNSGETPDREKHKPASDRADVFF
jgi:hypothetical protein